MDWDATFYTSDVPQCLRRLDEDLDFPGTTMTDLAERTVAAARSIYGNSVAGKVTDAFEARGIL